MQVLNSSVARPWKLEQKHVRAGFAAGLEGLKAMEIGAKQYDKEGTLFWTSKRRKSRRAKMGLPSTASFDRSESYTRIIDGQVRCITPDFKPKDLQVAWNVQFITVFVPHG